MGKVVRVSRNCVHVSDGHLEEQKGVLRVGQVDRGEVRQPDEAVALPEG